MLNIAYATVKGMMEAGRFPASLSKVVVVFSAEENALSLAVFTSAEIEMMLVDLPTEERDTLLRMSFEELEQRYGGQR